MYCDTNFVLQYNIDSLCIAIYCDTPSWNMYYSQHDWLYHWHAGMEEV